MEPIATSIAARGHEVHVVAPWHPLVDERRRGERRPLSLLQVRAEPALNVFGYAAAMRADVSLKGAAYVAAPLALAAGLARRRARSRGPIARRSCTVIGWCPAASSPPPRRRRLPLVVSLHGSDVYVAETLWPARRAARHGLRPRRRRDRVQRRSSRAGRLRSARTRTASTSCPTAWIRIASGPTRSSARGSRASLGIATHTPLLFAAGRLVRKKGFEYLIDALATIPQEVNVQAAIAGAGDLEAELRAPGRGGAHRLSRALSRQSVAGRRCRLAGHCRHGRDSLGPGRQRQRRRPAEHRARRRWRRGRRSSPLRPAASVRSSSHWRTGVLVPERDSVALRDGDPHTRARSRAARAARRGGARVGDGAIRLGIRRRPLRGRLRSGACHDEDRPITCFALSMPQPAVRISGSHRLLSLARSGDAAR